MSEDIYGADPKPVQNNEIRPNSHSLLTPPDLHAVGGLTYHQGADYGDADTGVTVVDGSQCVHDGATYYGGESLTVPRAVAEYWVRSGWAAVESATVPAETGGEAEPAKAPTKAKAPARSVSAGGGRRKG
jgi:hypothetical protein